MKTQKIDKFSENRDSDVYISSEISTYQEVEDFVREYPECGVRIIVIYEK